MGKTTPATGHAGRQGLGRVVTWHHQPAPAHLPSQGKTTRPQEASVAAREHTEQLRRRAAGEPRPELQAGEMAAPLQATRILRTKDARKKCDPEPRVCWGELGAVAPPPAAAEISQGLSGEPRNPPESLTGGSGGFHVNLFLSWRSPPTEFTLVGFFSFFRGSGGGRGTGGVCNGTSLCKVNISEGQRLRLPAEPSQKR